MILTLMVTGCGAKAEAEKSQTSTGKLTIYTTFYPLYDFTKKIAGQKAEIFMMVPAGVEPHDFEPTPKQIAEIEKADVFVYLDKSMEPWGHKIRENLAKKGVKVVEAGKGLVEDGDPHIWLDPNIAKEMARTIYDGLIIADDENKDFYGKNVTALYEEFDKLDEKYKKTLSKVEKKDIVTPHAAFGYLAKRYGLNQISIAGITPEHEPSPKKMAELTELIKEKNIEYIFFETMASPKLTEALAREVGAKTLVLNPLDGISSEEEKQGEDYFSIMKKNLENLKTALN